MARSFDEADRLLKQTFESQRREIKNIKKIWNLSTKKKNVKLLR